jgi:hypothetical protein
MILSIENPLSRGVVDRTVNTNPDERGIELTMQHLQKSKNHNNYFDSFYTGSRQLFTLSPSLDPVRIFPHGNSRDKNCT